MYTPSPIIKYMCQVKNLHCELCGLEAGEASNRRMLIYHYIIQLATNKDCSCRTIYNDYQAECHTPEYHIGIDLIKPCQIPVRVRYSGDNRLNTVWIISHLDLGSAMVAPPAC